MSRPYPKRPVAARFLDCVWPITESGCWLWNRHIRKNDGYGDFSIERKHILAHRAAYELFKGPIPSGMTVDHLCRVRQCVNPDHLEAVTLRENILRGVSPSAGYAKATHCKHGHEFTPDNTLHLSKKHGERRQCRACNRRREAVRRSKKRAAA